MKKLLAVLSVGALVALVAPTSAHAQSLNDIPEVGPEICAQWQALLDEFGPQAAGTPFEALVDGFQQLHDAACSGGEEEPPADEPDEGGDANPLCDPLEQIAAGMEDNGAPAEMSDGVRQIAAGIGCPAPEGGDEPPSDDGGEEPGPHCTVLAEIITGMEDNGAPAELIGGFQEIHDGAGCATDAGDGDDTTTTTTTAPAGDGDDDDTEVGGQTEVAQTGGGTATPATGGGLLAGGIGLGLIGLATASRRFFGTA